MKIKYFITILLFTLSVSEICGQEKISCNIRTSNNALTCLKDEKPGEFLRERASFEIEENYSNITGYSGKISCDYMKYRITVMDFRDDPSGKKEDKTVYSFYSPVISAGRFRKKGLYREITNPSSWYAGSETYTDFSELAEDCTLNRNGKWGIILSPCNNITAYASADENDDYRIIEKGGGLSFSMPDETHITAVISESIYDETSDDSWYRNRNYQYGYKICNSAVQISRKTGFLINSFSAGISYGKCFKTGKYFRYHPSADLGPLMLFFLVSWSDCSYRKPFRGYPSVKLRRGFKGEYEVCKYINIEAGYNIDIYHPEYLSDIKNRKGEKMFVKMEYDNDLFVFSPYAERNNCIEAEEYISKDCFGCRTGIRGDFIGFGFNPEYIYMQKKPVSRKAVYDCYLTDGTIKVDLCCRRTENEKIENLVKGKLSFTSEKIKIYSAGEYETVDENGVNLKSVFRFSAGGGLNW